jgi:two-component system sensor histidine kinase CpxA
MKPVPVLLVDDDVELCSSLTRLLAMDGFGVKAVHDGEAGIQHALKGEYELVILVESVAEDARFEGREEGKSVVIPRADDCWMRGDPALLRSCIENVVRNAVHYTKPQTEVTLSLQVVTERSDSARILVADHGDGVPPEALGRIFEPFYRVTEAREHQTGGTGLGLSIAQRIAIVHGGGIRARNRDGGGLEIEISVPVSVSKPSSDL